MSKRMNKETQFKQKLAYWLANEIAILKTNIYLK